MHIYLTGDDGWWGMSPGNISYASILKLGPSYGPHYPITEPPHFQTFLFIKIESWNSICIMFIQNGIQWYAYVLVNLPPGRTAALAWGRRPHFFVYKIESWKLVRINGGKWCPYIWINSPMDRVTALARGRSFPPLPKSFFYLPR